MIKELIREDDSQLYFIFEYMPDGNLYQLMKQSIEFKKNAHLSNMNNMNNISNLNDHSMNNHFNCLNSLNHLNHLNLNLISSNFTTAGGGGFLTPERIQSITMQVLKGLNHIHSHGYVHRG